MKNILFGLLAMASLFACEKTIQLDVKQVEETLIIDAKVTTDVQQHVVKLTKSQPFVSKGSSAGVSGAQVFVKDDANHEYRFVEKEKGVYVSETAFAGVTGRTYTLMVNVGGKTYTATEKMNKVVPYDSLTYRIDEEEKLNPKDSGRYYEALLYVHEPQETQDFYLFQFYRNGKLENEEGRTLYYSEDKLLNGRVDGLPFPILYAARDVAKIEIFNISPNAYKFYSDLAASLGSDGGIFSGQPANVYTNLSGGAKGFFLVAPVASGSVKIDF
jgi:hypothetical protein